MPQSTLPALDGDDGSSRTDDPQLQGALEAKANAVVDIGLPLVVLDTSWLRVPEWVAATVQVDLARSLLVSGD